MLQMVLFESKSNHRLAQYLVYPSPLHCDAFTGKTVFYIHAIDLEPCRHCAFSSFFACSAASLFFCGIL